MRRPLLAAVVIAAVTTGVLTGGAGAAPLPAEGGLYDDTGFCGGRFSESDTGTEWLFLCAGRHVTVHGGGADSGANGPETTAYVERFTCPAGGECTDDYRVGVIPDSDLEVAPGLQHARLRTQLDDCALEATLTSTSLATVQRGGSSFVDPNGRVQAYLDAGAFLDNTGQVSASVCGTSERLDYGRAFRSVVAGAGLVVLPGERER